MARTTDSGIKIIHNPHCSKCRATLALLNENNIQPEIVEYLDQPLSFADISKLLDYLGAEPRDIMRKHEAEYSNENLDDSMLTREQLIQAMAAHPILIERPIVVKGNKAIIGRPPSNVLTLI
ncbi:MAG: arsenate reductase (glutaredoxin) [Gammaproteobacteria bacterium]|nr:arsenate reductase (glutaredoxin) [Gammaproteobacteria bacterium]